MRLSRNSHKPAYSRTKVVAHGPLHMGPKPVSKGFRPRFGYFVYKLHSALSPVCGVLRIKVCGGVNKMRASDPRAPKFVKAEIEPFVPDEVGVLRNLLFLLCGGHRFRRANIKTRAGRQWMGHCDINCRRIRGRPPVHKNVVRPFPTFNLDLHSPHAGLLLPGRLSSI